MKSDTNFFVLARLKSFKYAWRGLQDLLLNEHNSRVHLVAMVFVFVLGWSFDINSYEWIAVVLCIGFVLSLEAINSALEALADYSSSDYQELIKKSKDLAAAGVLLSAITSVVIAGIIFVPKIIKCIYE